MGRPSAKRKARSEHGRQNIKKRWKKAETSQQAPLPTVSDASSTPDFSPPHTTHAHRDGDGNHHHIHCDSEWCVFKKAKDEGKPLPSHDTMKNYLRLDKKYEDRVREVFFDLSSPVLLERCLRGQSQNRNESFHSKLWSHQNKAKFAGLQRVTFVTQLSILDHNFGFVSNRFLQHLGISLTSKGVLSRQRMDKRKVTPPKPKKKSKKMSAPGPDYQPGSF